MEQEMLDRISNKGYNKATPVSEDDMDIIKNILAQQTVNCSNVKMYNQEDSQIVYLATLKFCCLSVIQQMLINGVKLPDYILNAVTDLLFENRRLPMGLNATIESQRIENDIFESVVEILYFTEFISDKLIKFLSNVSVADEISVNLAPLVNCQYKSYELSVLHSLDLGPVLVGFIESYKTKINQIVKQFIINKLISRIQTGNKQVIYSIFFAINEEPHDELLEYEEFECEEYVGFVCSLIHNLHSADLGFSKLQKYFDRLEVVLNKLINYFRMDHKNIRPKDEHTIFFILEAMNKLIRYKRKYFYKFVGLLQNILKYNAGRFIKGVVYEILSQFLHDNEVFIEKIVDCKKELDSEISKKDYFLMPRLIKFLNAYGLRVEKEKRIFKVGTSSGSPYLSNLIENVDYKMLGLRSEDPQTVIECFETEVSIDTIKLNSTHIRAAMIKNLEVINQIVNYQLKRNTVIDDISIINIIICTKNPLFFEYVRLFDNFSNFLNSDVLERISDDLPAGLKWLIDGLRDSSSNDLISLSSNTSPAYSSIRDMSLDLQGSVVNSSSNASSDSSNSLLFLKRKQGSKEFGEFIIRNCNFFNEILDSNRWVQKKLLEIYNLVLDEHIGKFEIKIIPKSGISTAVDILFVDGSDEFITNDFFIIFSKQLIYTKFYKDVEIDDFVLKNQYIHGGYADYVKAKAVVGLEIKDDIQFLRRNLIDVDELIGFVRITEEDKNIKTMVTNSDNIYANFGKEDMNYFMKVFPQASKLEKFILFFGLRKTTKEIEDMIKEEVLKNLKNTNKLYLEMCVLQLFRCTDLDNILRVLERNFGDKELLMKLSLHNILNGGRYFSNSLLESAEKDERNKTIFLLYYLSIWDKEIVYQLIDKKSVLDSPDIKYLVDDIQNSKY